MQKFRELGLSDNCLAALAKKGFEEPTPIQAKTIPLLLKGNRDLVGQAQTGTGKTAAFGLPLIELLDQNSPHVQALILTPTRELAIQVAEEINSFRGSKKIFVLPVYGGQSYELQIRGLKRGAQIVVGTPGRIRDHLQKQTLRLSQVSHVVLDEADEMLDMGFQEEVEDILKSVPQSARMLLFSATMPPEILKLARQYMKEFDLLEVKNDQLTTPLTEQIYFEVKDNERFEALCRIIDVEPNFYGIVFCRTKVETNDVARRLSDRGYDAEPIHGDISQAQREKVLRAFKARKISILVATDVAARGIDVQDLSHVVNFHIPQDPEAYVHRIGRTGRAGNHGTAITFISPSELRSLLFIQKIANAKIKKQKLPDAKQVILTKKEKLKNELQSLLSSGNFESYLPLAQELLGGGLDAQQVIASLLQYSFGDELKEESYLQLQQFADSLDLKGSTRLFVAKGKSDGMNVQKLKEFLSSKGGIDPMHIKDVQMFDKFSFINVPFLEAEQLLAMFEKDKQRRKPLITRAKDKTSPGSHSANTYPSYQSSPAESDRPKSKKKRNEKDDLFPKNTSDKKKPAHQHSNKNDVPQYQRSSQVKQSFPTTENTPPSFSFSDEDLAW